MYFSDDDVNNDFEAMKEEILRHVQLGQWQLAKSLIFLAWKQETDETKKFVTNLLVNLAAQPEKICLNSLTIKSYHHLSWLAVQLMKELGMKHPQLKLIEETVDFKLHLYKASKLCEKIPFEDLLAYFEKQQTKCSTDFFLPANIVHFFYDLKSKNPSLAWFIKDLLLPDEAADYWTELSVIWIRKNLDSIEMGQKDEKRVGEEILAELQTQIFFSSSKKDFRLPDEICSRLSSLCDRGVIQKNDLYEVLSGNLCCAEKFCRVEDEIKGRIGLEDDLKAARNFLEAVFCPEGVVNLKELCLRCVRKKEHFLEMILNYLLLLTERKFYEEVSSYLNYDLTSNFRPLIILLSWDKIKDSQDAFELSQHLWPLKLEKDKFDQNLVKICDKLFRGVELVNWCLQQREKNPEAAKDTDCSFSNLCFSFKSHSVLHVLNQHLDVFKLKEDEVEDILDKYTNVRKKKSVSFAEDENLDLYINRSVDCKVFQGCLIVNHAIEAMKYCSEMESCRRGKRMSFLNSPEPLENDPTYKEKVIDNLEKTKTRLGTLYPLCYRLEILATLFSLIFVTHHDLNADVSSDSDQGCSESEYQSKKFEKSGKEDENGTNGDQTSRKKQNKIYSRSSSDNNMISHLHHEFLCDDFIVNFLLSCIKDNLMDISLKLDRKEELGENLLFWNEEENNDVQEFSITVGELKKDVLEAIWRFEIVPKNGEENGNSARIENFSLLLKKDQLRTGNDLDSPTKITELSSFSLSGNSIKRYRHRSRSFLRFALSEGCFSQNCSHGTINKMLASKESLLNICIQQLDLIRAEQVIKIFRMEDTNTAAEVAFAQNYFEISNQLQSDDVMPEPVSPSIPSSSSFLSLNLNHIASAAATGMSAMEVATKVDDYLSRCVVPKVSGLEEYLTEASSSFCPALVECMDSKALVLCDLAFTSCPNLESCSSLLRAALKRIKTTDNMKGMMGLANFANQMMSLLSEVKEMQRNDSLELFGRTEFPKVKNFSELLMNGTFPLQSSEYLAWVEHYNTLFVNLEKYFAAEKALEESETSENQNAAENERHKAFAKLVQENTSHLRSQLQLNNDRNEYPNYLKTLYVYMRQLASLKAHQNPTRKDATSFYKYLHVLNEGLTPTLIGMLNDENVAIEWLETFAKHVGFGLEHIITQACVGAIPAHGIRPVGYDGITMNNFGQYVLNDFPICEKMSLHPNLVSEILSQILQFITDNCEVIDGLVVFEEIQKFSNDFTLQKLLKRSSELSQVDLTLCENDEECWTFLVNLANLMTLHAFILRDCETNLYFGPSRLLSESCQVVYLVGQLGVISLFEVRSMLGDVTTSSYKLNKKICDMKRSVFKRDLKTCDEKIGFLLSHCYLSSPKFTVVDPKNFEYMKNSALNDYKEAHLRINSSENEIIIPERMQKIFRLKDNVELLLSFLPEIDLKNLKQIRKFSHSVTPANYRPVVLLSYSSSELKSVQNPPEKIIVHVKKIPQTVRDFLHKKCFIAAYVLDVLDGVDVEGPVLNRLLKECGNLSPVEILIPSVHEFNFWLELDEMITSECNLEEILQYIEFTTKFRVELTKSLSSLRDFIFCCLFDENSVDFSPLKLKNVDLQASCVLAMYKEWDYKTCKECLLEIATNYELKKELCDEVTNVYRRVELYEELKNVLGEFIRWQDVEEESTKNPETMWRTLLDKQIFSLALKWAALHQLPHDLNKTINVLNLMTYLNKNEPDTVQATILLENIKTQSLAVDMCEEVLCMLDQNLTNNLSSKAFVYEYLLKDLAPGLSKSRKQELHYKNMGIKILSCLNHRESFLNISTNPAIMLEQLIMNMKMELLGKALKAILSDAAALDPHDSCSTESIKNLLKVYAKKSLDVPRVQPKLTPIETFSNSFSAKGNDFIVPLKPPIKENWIPDENIKACMVCKKETFNMFNRRHHCRRCGRVVCGNCSKHRACVDGYEEVKVRICDDCNVSMYHNTEMNRSSYSGSFGGGSRSPSVVSCSSNVFPKSLSDELLSWTLTLNDEHNIAVREEFNFEQTPNVSLCISLLGCFPDANEAAEFTLELCESLFGVLRPIDSSGSPRQDVNHNIIINVLETLILNAKMTFDNQSNLIGMASCDDRLINLNLVKVLIYSDCYHLIPKKGISSADDIKRLRDQLIGEERWNLALEVTTKNGLDATAVWMNWGLALLKSGFMEIAREKFSHCFETLSEKSFLTASSEGILSEIIKQLESNLYLDEISTDKNLSLTLRAIIKEGGKAIVSTKRHGKKKNEIIFKECLYYFEKYASPTALISFLIKHKRIDLALNVFEKKNCSHDDFFKFIFIPCVRSRKISSLGDELKQLDPSLKRWQKLLTSTCKCLERQNLFHTLYELQLFCHDYIRAAMTCIKIFSESAKDYHFLFSKLQYMDRARKHLNAASFFEEELPQSAKKLPSWTNTSDLQKWLPLKDIQRYLNFVNMQITITKYLHESECDLRNLLDQTNESSLEQRKSKLLPVIFGNSTEKIELAALLILAGKNIDAGFSMAHKVIQLCRLDGLRIFTMAGRSLVNKGRFDDINKLIECIVESREFSAEIVDNVVFSWILLLVGENTDSVDVQSKTEADKLISHLRSRQHKIGANILCKKFKKAYLIAIANPALPNEVERIAKAAERRQDKPIRNMCEKWLADNRKS